MKLLLLVLLSLMSGCSTYQWVKEGKSEYDMHKKLISCQADALVKMPPDNQVYGADSYETKIRKNKDKIDKKEKYYREFDQDSVSYNISDANEGPREVLIKHCMIEDNWHLVEIKN